MGFHVSLGECRPEACPCFFWSQGTPCSLSRRTFANKACERVLEGYGFGVQGLGFRVQGVGLTCRVRGTS